jgi:hypothetical protein
MWHQGTVMFKTIFYRIRMSVIGVFILLLISCAGYIDPGYDYSYYGNDRYYFGYSGYYKKHYYYSPYYYKRPFIRKYYKNKYYKPYRKHYRKPYYYKHDYYKRGFQKRDRHYRDRPKHRYQRRYDRGRQFRGH